MDEMEKNIPEQEEAAEAESLRLTFKITEDEVVNTLDKMDKLQGSNKKQQIIFALIMAIAAIDAYQFITTKSGFALILTMLFLVLGVFYKKKSNFSNRRLGEAFAADPQQLVEVQEDQLQLTDRATSYEEIKVMYEFKQSFGLHYMSNYYFVIPKKVFGSEKQLEEFRSVMKEKLQEKFVDQSAKM
ncbi:MAG: YcxB family protein [Oscillospiraceae bacterium]|nr:YcxB family protein [Oscillospiraceae bacterium]